MPKKDRFRHAKARFVVTAKQSRSSFRSLVGLLSEAFPDTELQPALEDFEKSLERLGGLITDCYDHLAELESDDDEPTPPRRPMDRRKVTRPLRRKR